MRKEKSMALLEPNTTYSILGVPVKEKIIPDGTRWKDPAKAKRSGFSANALYKKQKKLSDDTGKVQSVTIHNTDDLDRVEDDGEQYTRATYNENMNSVRIHFYVDDLGAWQDLKAGTGMSVNDPEGFAEVSWHAGDGSVTDGGNMTSLSIEIIMNDTPDHDEKAKDNGARIAAWLLWKHGLTVNDLVTHTYWVNKSAGKIFKDRDEQCTTPVPGKKWCPSYIFASTGHSTALANWKAFKDRVQKYLNELQQPVAELQSSAPVPAVSDEIKAGDLVTLAADAVYYNGKAIPAWVKNQNWYVKECRSDRAVIDASENGSHNICSPVNTKYLTVVQKTIRQDAETVFVPYLVKITSASHNIYKGPGTNYVRVGQITDKGVYTIVKESSGVGSEKWGRLKSGAGWISLYGTEKRG